MVKFHICIIQKGTIYSIHQIAEIMEKKLFTYWALVLLLSLASNQLMAAYSGSGSGTIGDPYQVATKAHLNEVRDHLTAYFIQTADITFAAADFQSGGTYYNLGEGWEPIAGNGTENKFTGQYDGAGYSISNLMISRGGTANVGLFGHIGRGGVVKNVELVNATVTGGRGTGALIGRVTGDQSTRIEHCSATGTVAGDAATGGLVGSNNSYKLNSGAAEAFRPVIYACWADVDVSLRAANADMQKYGGLTGCNQKGFISNCYAMGDVTVNNASAQRIGGLAGCIEFRGIIINSYSTGAVSANASATLVGAQIGKVGEKNNLGTISQCFYDGTSSHVDNSYGTRLSTSDMKNSANFSDWDFDYIWDINGSDNGGYPFLRETPPAPTEFVWDGSESSVWTVPGNWEGNTVPTATDAVRIPSGASNQPAISTNVTIKDLEMESGRIITIADGFTMTVTGGLTISQVETFPQITGAGYLVLAGNDLQEIPQLIVSNLRIDNYNNAKLTGNLTVSGTLDMVQGLLDLNGNDIDLGTTGKLNEWEDSDNGISSRIYGTLGTVTAVKTFETINEANLGINITGIDGDIGNITITRGHYAVEGQGESQSILRWFDISPSGTNSGLDATVEFTYFMGDLEYSGEVPGFSLFKRPLAGGVDSWEVVPSTASTTDTLKTLTAANVESFSRWTAANSNSPMPIILLSFNGKPVNDRVELTWVTAAEINNDFFSIERSVNGSDFEEIAVVEGAGTTSQSKRYSLNDNEPLNGVSYYRLKQTDYNGEFEYSKPISVYLDSPRMTDVKVYPNPSNGRFQVVTDAEMDLEYRIVDMQGRTITTGVARPQTVNTIEMPHAPQGIYSLVLISDEVQTKMIKIL
jgi:hypothetical protein